MTTVERAVAALEDLGLTQYEAQCFVGLTRLPQGTAKEISQVADVPRSRVYDVVDRLHERGLVDVQGSEPREYRAVSVEAAFRILREEHRNRIDAAERLLGELETAESMEDKGVWAIAQHEHVTERMVSLVQDATEEIHVIVAADRVVEERILQELAEAAGRGVDIVIEVPSEDVADRVLEATPEAKVVLAPELAEVEKVEQKWPGQILMVDRHAILASGLEDSGLPDVVKETAVWTSGVNHGFAAWMRELLVDRLDGLDSEVLSDS